MQTEQGERGGEGAGSAPVDRVEGVSSDQLWRAAIVAARRAAAAAAELRQTLDASRRAERA